MCFLTIKQIILDTLKTKKNAPFGLESTFAINLALLAEE